MTIDSIMAQLANPIFLAFCAAALPVALAALTRLVKLHQARGDVDALGESATGLLPVSAADVPPWLVPVASCLGGLRTEHQGKPGRTGSAAQAVHPADLDPPWGGADAAPTLFAWLGMLGTFFGVAIALSGLNLQDANAEEVSRQIQDMVGPLGSAFWTSIGGLGLAFVFRVMLLWSRARLDNAVARLLHEYDKTYPYVSPAETLVAAIDKAAGPSRDAAASLAALNTALVGVGRSGLLAELLRAQKATTQAIVDRPDPVAPLNTLIKRLDAHAEAAATRHADVQTIRDNTDTLSDELAGAIENAIIDAVKGKDGVPGLMQKVEDVAKTISEGQQSSAGTMADQLVNSIDERIGPRLESFGESVERVVNVNNGWEGQLGKLHAQLEGATADLQSASQALKDTGSELDASTQALGTTFTQANTTLTTLNTSLANMATQVNGLSEATEATRGDWTTERESWKDTANELHKLKGAVEGMSALWGAWTDALDEQTKLTQAVADDRKQGEALLTQIRTAATGFADVSEKMSTLSGSLKADLDAIQAQRDAGDTAIDDKLKRLGDLASHTQALFDGYEQTFSELATSMPDLTAALGAVDSVTERQSAALNIADKLAGRLEDASTQVQSLGTVLQPLQDAALSLTPAATQLSEGATALADVLARSVQTLDATRNTAAALTQVSQTLQGNTKDAADAWKKSAGDLQSSRESLEAAALGLQDAATSFGAQVKGTVNDLGDQQDKQLSNAVAHLTKAVSALSGMATSLGQAVQPLAEALEDHHRQGRR